MKAIALFSLAFILVLFACYLYWRFVWFFRNPSRKTPDGDHIVSPADGTVVYAKRLDPRENVISVKKNVRLSINDIVREDLRQPKILIGIFMSPLDVHHNRAPLSGTIEFIRHHPPTLKNICMGSMHRRILMKRFPFHGNSIHILQNERKVTKISGLLGENPVSCYVIQIAAKTVNGIDSYYPEGSFVEKGRIFGMIRIGSQVDVVVPATAGMEIRVRPGQRVRAGESILIS
jgi:phosphatidylserine decarboxylase